LNGTVRNELKIVVVGAGWIAERVHLPHIVATERLQLVAIVEPRQERRQQIERRYSVPAYARLEEIPRMDVDVAVVCTPPGSHAVLITLCLERGWHVVSEKPFVTLASDARRILDLALARGLSLRCCQSSRFRGDVRVLADSLASGMLGETRHARLSWRRARGVPATPGGRDAGVIWDLGAHLVDLLWHLTKPGWPRDVSAVATRLCASESRHTIATWQRGDHHRSPDDVLAGAVIQMRFPQSTATIELHWATAIEPDETEIYLVGTDGCALLRSVFGNSPDRTRGTYQGLTVTSRGATVAVDLDAGYAREDYAAQESFVFADLSSGGVWPEREDLIHGVQVLELATRQCTEAAEL
jgi:predicted dehydrogenase